MENSLSAYQELLGRLNRSKSNQRRGSDGGRSAPTREALRKEQEALREERRKGIKSDFVDTMPKINFPFPKAVQGVEPKINFPFPEAVRGIEPKINFPFPEAVRGIDFAQGQPSGGSISGPKSTPMDSLTGEALIQARKEHQAKLAARDTKLQGIMKGF